MNYEKEITPVKKTAFLTLSVLDLTSLNDDDTDADIEALCDKAISICGTVAAVCVWPQFVSLAVNILKGSSVKVAAVANFPEGSTNIESSVETCEQIVSAGGQEVDVVFPYSAFLSGNKEIGAKLISACKVACGDSAKLKVIIETGELKTVDLIKEASQIALDNGADFIKTSTGKVPISATLDAAKAMLEVLRDDKLDAGFKAAGGIKDIDTAAEYISLAENIMGKDWVKAKNFRFGASGIIDNLFAIIQDETPQNTKVEGY